MHEEVKKMEECVCVCKTVREREVVERTPLHLNLDRINELYRIDRASMCSAKKESVYLLLPVTHLTMYVCYRVCLYL